MDIISNCCAVNERLCLIVTVSGDLLQGMRPLCGCLQLEGEKGGSGIGEHIYLPVSDMQMVERGRGTRMMEEEG